MIVPIISIRSRVSPRMAKPMAMAETGISIVTSKTLEEVASQQPLVVVTSPGKGYKWRFDGRRYDRFFAGNRLDDLMLAAFDLEDELADERLAGSHHRARPGQVPGHALPGR